MHAAQNRTAFLTDIFAIFIRLVEFKTLSCCNSTKVLSNATEWVNQGVSEFAREECCKALTALTYTSTYVAKEANLSEKLWLLVKCLAFK